MANDAGQGCGGNQKARRDNHQTCLCHENEAKLRKALESVQESEEPLANEPVGAGH